MTGEKWSRVAAAGVSFRMPLERINSRGRLGPRASLRLLGSSASLSPDKEAGGGERTPPFAQRASPRLAHQMLPLIRPRDARAAVQASLGRIGRPKASESLSSLAARSRYSALLPELELRVRRLLDASARLSPTSYDSDRLIESDSARLWLEARTSWSLDRLLFAKEELAVSRMRRVLDEKREKRAEAVVDLLFAWQSSWFDLSDPTSTYDECRRAWLQVQQLATQLDLETQQWFSNWRKGAPELKVDCRSRLDDPTRDGLDLGAGFSDAL